MTQVAPFVVETYGDLKVYDLGQPNQEIDESQEVKLLENLSDFPDEVAEKIFIGGDLRKSLNDYFGILDFMEQLKLTPYDIANLILVEDFRPDALIDTDGVYVYAGLDDWFDRYFEAIDWNDPFMQILARHIDKQGVFDDATKMSETAELGDGKIIEFID